MKPVNRFILRCLPLIIACQISVEPLSGGMFSSRSFDKIIIFPEQVDLNGSQSQQQFLVTGIDSAGNEIDLTHLAEWTASQPDIVNLDQGGVASPKGNGSTDITARWKGLTATAVVSVSHHTQPVPLNFTNDLVPIFTRNGCNSGGCHGKASGQNGFKLSLLGFEPLFDYDAIVKQLRGRRVFPADPDRSLILQKASGQLPHGGGKRLNPKSQEYQLIRDWIAEGMPYGSPNDAQVSSISIWPTHRLMTEKNTQQLAVTAKYSDGTHRDVTRLTEFYSNNPEAANVSEHGVVSTLNVPGETAIIARYQNQVEVFRAIMPVREGLGHLWKFPQNNFIDQHTSAKWQQLGLVPSNLCTDQEFIRRLSLDICGSLPTASEVRRFLQNPDPDKRNALIDQLLSHNRYADYFSLIWADILHNRRQRVEHYRYGTYRFHAWLRQQFLHNRRYDDLVRDILGAQGDIQTHPPVVFHRLIRNTDQYVEHTSQLFLGVQMSCAQCHHHPFERWSQDDYWGLAAFFSRVGRKDPEKIFDFPPKNEWIFSKTEGEIRHPRTGKVVLPKPLDGKSLQIHAPEDPRHVLVDWMTAPDNPFFARALVNRYWAHFLSIGVVHPEDDLRVSNPPSNSELLDALASHFIQSGFDLKDLVRTITQSRTYQLSSVPNRFNQSDQLNYSRFYPKRLQAEVLLDAISQVTNVPSEFDGGTTFGIYGRRQAGSFPEGMRAVQLPDESVPSYFLDIFGRPARSTACQCERVDQPSLAQSLTLMNSDDIQQKIRHRDGRAAQFAKDPRPDSVKLEDLFLWAHARSPLETERAFFLEYLGEHQNRKQDAYANILWSLINSEEFQLNY